MLMVPLDFNNSFLFATNHMFQLALQANDNADYFPVWVRLSTTSVASSLLEYHGTPATADATV